MSGQVEFLSQSVDYLGFIEAQLRGLQGISTLTYELIQNADDVLDEDGNPAASRVTFDICDDALVVENDGVFRKVDFERMGKLAFGGKRDETGTTGAFGIGFISVYQITDSPEIFSSGRHWRIRPDMPSEKNIEQKRVPTKLTRFRLPWAFEASEVRRQLRIQTVEHHQLDSFQEGMEQAILLASLFLKQLTVLELKRSGQPVRHIERIEEGNQVLLDDGERMIEWRILHGDFEDEAQVLRSEYKYQIEKKRQCNVALAIPDKPLQDGTLFAVLPTETTVPLPFHINADFYPSPDRKRILFDQDYQSEWNRAAVHAAARALANGFEELPDLLGHKGLWQALERLDECRRRVEKGEHDQAFASFWEEVAPSLQTSRIVFTAEEQWVTPSEARLLESDAEEEAAPIIQALGIRVVHPDLRPYFGLLRQTEIGTPLLSVQDVVDAMKCTGLDRRVPLAQAPPYLRSVEDWQTLWAALDAMLERRQVPEALEPAKETLRSCAIALDANETLQLPTDLFRGDASTEALFPDVSWIGEYGESDEVPGRLVIEFTAKDAVEFVSTMSGEHWEAEWQSGELDLEALYSWFESRKSEILGAPELMEALCALPVWPASGYLRPLSGLYMPGGFDDPLELSALVDLKALGGRREFLSDLGVQELTFETYVRGEVPRVLEERSDLTADKRRQLVQLLAQRLGEMRGDEDLRDCLSHLRLIECTDGDFRPAEQVYAHSDVVMDVLGDRVHVAAPVSQNADAVQALHEWLGVAQEPRPGDVIQRIYALTTSPPDEADVQIVETTFDYLVSHWSKWDETEQQQYEPLRNLAWLPGTGNRARWYRSGELYAVFRSFLFETQATFLALPRKLQNRAGTVGLIEFLGIKTEPTSDQVVRHLRFCSERREQINKEVYRFLNEHADDPAIRQLQDQACLLLLDDHYVRPDQVYWTKHPFGSFRYQLGPELRQYGALFERLGVREHPEDQDFIQVLLEISEQYGQRHTPLDDQTHAVVMRCWEGLSTAMETERLVPDNLTELRGKEVIPDPRHLLTNPDYLFFEDRAGLAAKFSDFLKNSVVARPQGAWRAMEAVGVRRLSQAVELRLLECKDAVDDRMLTQRVQERRQLVARVIESERASGIDGLDTDALERLQFQQTRELVIQYSLQAFRRTVTTDSESVPALLMPEEYTLLTVHENGRTPWPAVARELAYAIKPLGEIGGLAGGIKEVLASDLLEEARRTLDELGYPPLQERMDTKVTGTGVVDDLGGGELSPEEAVGAILGGHGADRTDMPETPPETPPGGGEPGKGGGEPPRKRQPQGKLRTYVVGEDDGTKGEPDTAAAEHRSKVDQAGIHHVLEYEEAHGRAPNEMPHYHKGYDVESRDAEGDVRYIEAKSLSGDWGTRNAAGLTKTQFEMARELGEQFWLYVVERATSDDYQIYCIQDPANQVNQYLFDDGWQALAESAKTMQIPEG